MQHTAQSTYVALQVYGSKISGDTDDIMGDNSGIPGLLLGFSCASVQVARLAVGMQMPLSALIRDPVIELQMH